MRRSVALVVLSFWLPAQDSLIRMARQPRIAPDGQAVAFAWQADLWVAAIGDGVARRLTVHPGDDHSPHWSPDGTQIAFVSERTGTPQVFVMARDGSEPRQVTQDAKRKQLLGFAAGGKELLVAVPTEAGWPASEAMRLFVVDLDGKTPKRLLADLPASDAALSPDGTKLLFTRGRASWWRKQYRGAAALQLWLADLTVEPPGLMRLTQDRPDFQNVSEMDPMWAPDGAGYWFVSDPDGTLDVWYRRLDGAALARVTRGHDLDHSDDGVAFPSVSADGRRMVVRHRFDLAVVDLPTGGVTRLQLRVAGDPTAPYVERRSESSASDVAFTQDGKQLAFVAGDDVYVMDRVLKEPRRVTWTPDRERELCFAPDGRRLWFVSEAGGEVDLWEATCQDADGYWWRAGDFPLRRVTEDAVEERDLEPSPTGVHLAFVKGSDLYVMDADGGDHRRVAAMWSPPSFDWAPDGKWLTYATQDDDYNSEVFVVPLDGTRAPFNLSRHPDNDATPTWSPDGSRIAWVGRRDGEELDIYYVNLSHKAEETSARDRKIEDALEAMRKKPQRGGAKAGETNAERPEGSRGRGQRAAETKPAESGGDEPEPKKAAGQPVEVVIDFDGIVDRIHRVAIADAVEAGLLWAPDSKRLAFSATIKGERGIYTVAFPEPKEPSKLGSGILTRARWLPDTDEIVGLSVAAPAPADEPNAPTPPGPRRGAGGAPNERRGGVPAALNSRGDLTTFAGNVRWVRDWRALRQVVFDQGWRALRDRFYDAALNDRDWSAVRAKYQPIARECLGRDEFSEVMDLMLGELNASHLGYSGSSDPLPQPPREGRWTPVTYSLGLRFANEKLERGWRVHGVIPKSPCALARSRVHAGEIVLAVDGNPVSGAVDPDVALTLDELRDVELEVQDKAGVTRRVVVRPVASLDDLLYDEWVEGNRRQVEDLSLGRLGYLHIRGMSLPSLRQMESDLYHAGEGKDGLVIDVRWNGGGSTTDHVLTMLTQPQHAFTQSRGSGFGYPQDRLVYAAWQRPIVVLCNEHSFSNAEIFAHAIKQIGRGPVVGMRTAGGVISTGAAMLQDGSTIRLPGRGWFLASTGEDMELNGCLPDIALWNPPGGPDLQLAAGVKALGEQVAKAKASAAPMPASARRRAATGSGGR